MSGSPACDVCGAGTPDALARQVVLAVDGASLDEQHLCPTCFAEWVERYEQQLATGSLGGTGEAGATDAGGFGGGGGLDFGGADAEDGSAAGDAVDEQEAAEADDGPVLDFGDDEDDDGGAALFVD